MDFLDVEIVSVGAPAGVRAVRVVSVSPESLDAAVAQALARPTPSASPTFV